MCVTHTIKHLQLVTLKRKLSRPTPTRDIQADGLMLMASHIVTQIQIHFYVL